MYIDVCDADGVPWTEDGKKVILKVCMPEDLDSDPTPETQASILPKVTGGAWLYEWIVSRHPDGQVMAHYVGKTVQGLQARVHQYWRVMVPRLWSAFHTSSQIKVDKDKLRWIHFWLCYAYENRQSTTVTLRLTPIAWSSASERAQQLHAMEAARIASRHADYAQRTPPERFAMTNYMPHMGRMFELLRKLPVPASCAINCSCALSSASAVRAPSPWPNHPELHNYLQQALSNVGSAWPAWCAAETNYGNLMRHIGVNYP